MTDAYTAMAHESFHLVISVWEETESRHLQEFEELRAKIKLPLVVIGRRTNSGIKVLSRKAGATDYIVWPTEPAELLVRVDVIVRIIVNLTGQGSMSEIAPGVELDTRKQVVIVQGEEKLLTPAELRLLRYLAERPGWTCSREELLNAVWGWDQAISSRSVDVYINSLRKKIEPNPRKPKHLITVRGYGYKFEK